MGENPILAYNEIDELTLTGTGWKSINTMYLIYRLINILA